jgi:hypothetical protein
MGAATALVQDTLDDQTSAVLGQTGVTVDHESLRVVWVLDKPHPIRGLSLDQPPLTVCQDTSSVTNVLTEYT